MTSMNNLANALRSAGRIADDIPHYEEDLIPTKKPRGPKHPECQ
jgi:hypothetical protein